MIDRQDVWCEVAAQLWLILAILGHPAEKTQSTCHTVSYSKIWPINHAFWVELFHSVTFKNVQIFENGNNKHYVTSAKNGMLCGGQDKTADFKWDKTADFENETKQPISKMRQNRRSRKWDKIADFKVGQDGRFCWREQIAIKVVSLIKASWPNYR